MKTETQMNPMKFFFFVSASYLVTSTLAKYLHELGHATIAFFLGVPISSMSIIVNPFGSGYFRPTKFGFPTSIFENALFTTAGAVLPILVLSLLYQATKRSGQMTKWLVGMLFGYSLLSNAVNLVSGAFTRASDGGYLVFLDLPVVWLVAICIVMGGLGALILIKNNFKVIVLSVQGLTNRIFVFSGFLFSSIMGVALVGWLGDSFRRRLFFFSFEVLLLGSLFLVASILPRRKELSKEQDVLKRVPNSTWILLLSGTILSSVSIALYAVSGITKT